MACTIQEVLKSKRNAGNTASIIIAKLLCDSVSDLPSQTGLTGYELAQGCTAHVIDDNQDYMIDSSGNWHVYGGEMWTNVYTKSETDALLDGKQDELTTAQLDAVNSGITAAKLTADEATLAEVVDSGAKNILKFDKAGTSAANASTSYETNGVTFTVNQDGSVTVSGTLVANASAYCYLYLGSDRANVIGAFDGNHVIAGNPTGASISTYRLWYKVGSETAVSEPTNGTVLPDKSSQSNAVIGLQVNADGSGWTGNVIFKPMLCTKSAWDVSHAFVPYAPTNRELYEMILALQ